MMANAGGVCYDDGCAGDWGAEAGKRLLPSAGVPILAFVDGPRSGHNFTPRTFADHGP